MQYKLIIFDLDGTLAPVGKGMTAETISALQELECRGCYIAVCSGKPVYYLCGMMRQVGLQQPILIGDNGAVLQFGVDLPPKHYSILPYSKKAETTIAFLRKHLTEEFPDLWYQPNQVGLTPFFRTSAQADAIAHRLAEWKACIEDVDIYRHGDCYDFVPVGISKYFGLKALAEETGISSEDMLAVGDGVNDYPMFDFAGFSIGIGLEQPEKVSKNVNSISEALQYLLER